MSRAQNAAIAASEVRARDMNKLTIRNGNYNPSAVDIIVNDVNISKMANRAELIFEPCSVPVLRVDIPIMDTSVELLDSTIEYTNFGKICSPVDFESENEQDKDDSFDRRKAEIRAEIEKQKEIMK